SNTDEVGEIIAVHVGGEPRIGVVAGPATRRVAASEIADSENRRYKTAVALAQGGERARFAETDDVGVAVPVHVAENARVQILARPTAAGQAGAEPDQSQDRRGEGAVR